MGSPDMTKARQQMLAGLVDADREAVRLWRSLGQGLQFMGTRLPSDGRLSHN
jgi:hypothetical protein